MTTKERPACSKKRWSWLLLIPFLGGFVLVPIGIIFDSAPVIKGCYGDTLAFPWQIPWSDESIGIFILSIVNDTQAIILSKNPNNTEIEYMDQRFTVDEDIVHLIGFQPGDVGVYLAHQYPIPEPPYKDVKLSAKGGCSQHRHKFLTSTKEIWSTASDIDLSTAADHAVIEPDRFQKVTLSDANNAETVTARQIFRAHTDSHLIAVVYGLGIVVVINTLLIAGLVFTCVYYLVRIKGRKPKEEAVIPENERLTET